MLLTWTPVGAPAGPRTRIRLAAVLAAALAYTVPAGAETRLPYTPTTILLSGPASSNTTTTAYIFVPDGDLLSVDISGHLTADTLHPQTLTSGLPFLGTGHTSFAPSILANGTIAILAGDCATAAAATVWTYTPAGWTQHTTTTTSSQASTTAPYFLGSSLSFSAQLAPVMSDPVLYIYGGMCPFANTTTATWQSAAAYSNRMLRISSSDTTTGAFAAGYTSSAGPPIAEAGFSLTALAPSLTNRSDGIVTQQTSHVLLGGHTPHAFINVSTIAIWSLPEETWSFVDINPGKDAAVVGGRSGHTTVLSEDGTYLVVFGGWYGETDQAASPQLVVIKIGVGMTDWEFAVPAAAQPSGGGVYGHGAVVLPGNVMMVYGGYDIGSATKRDAAAASQMFLNITSMTWSAEYMNPNYAPPETTAAPGNTSTTSGSSTRAVGLGIGLGLGVPLLLVLCLVAICLRRRQQRRRAQRNEALRGLAQGMRGGTLPASGSEGDAMLERDHDHGAAAGMFPWNAAAARDWYTGGSDPYVQGQRSLGYETLRGASARNHAGPSVYMPTPPMAAAAGRPRNARGLYQPTTGLSRGSSYDFPELRAPGGIHPIYEDDEDEERDGDDGGISPERDEDHEGDDPFQTPRGGATPNTSSSAITSMPPRGQDPEVRGWVSDVDAADAVLSARISRHGSTTTTPPATHAAGQPPAPMTPTRPSHAGRISPTRRASVKNSSAASSSGSITTAETDETRTGSNLSDRSAFSFVQGAERTATLSPARASLPVASRAALLIPADISAKPGSSGSNSSGSSSHHTFSTAKSTFGTLQAEGPGLLLGAGAVRNVKRRSYAEDEGGYYKYTSGDGDIDREGDGEGEMIEDDYVDVPGSPSKSKPRRSWFGSLRRVFSGATPSPEGSAGSPTRESLLDSSGADYDGRLGASTSVGTLLRRKQGREAWEEGTGGVQRDDEWDVERTMEQRLVQVMFTVPKERLRVVNAEVEREEEDGFGEDGGEKSGDQYRWDEDEHGEKGGYGDDEGKGKEREGGSIGGGSLDPAAAAAAAGPGHHAVPGGLSPSPSVRSSSVTTTIHTAEAVRLERPRTRVLEMVESIESHSSRDSSPSSSPTRKLS
ncbi:hypothetical protein B0T22DRAFT_127175 [Podospora appendiculata]|uniref:Galactose oxidase n=1 Tax=Podospora appendiculata TaxID=314037 RepID=A0AAE1CBF2_9PEZI|nr:hypothetical protein B0T22DRAFT_127175 [Podospora appendiculata]